MTKERNTLPQTTDNAVSGNGARRSHDATALTLGTIYESPDRRGQINLEETRADLWTIFSEYHEVVKSEKPVSRGLIAKMGEKDAYMTPASTTRPTSTLVMVIQPLSSLDNTLHIPKTTIETMLSRWNPVSSTIRDGGLSGSVTGWLSSRSLSLLEKG